ncbi:putative sulfate transporter [Candida tropicalis]
MKRTPRSVNDSSERSRITSPSPSVRHISQKRVHNERSSLLKDNNHFNYLLDSQPTDIESIIYQKPTQSEYVPTLTQTLANLEWSDILPYYIPCLSWIDQYNLKFFIGDLIGGLTLVFFQLPLSLSYATSLAHVPVTSGLYSLGISPLIYLVFGSVPQMIVGPEAPISLIVGQAIEPLLHHDHKKELDPLEYVVAITFVSGATLLGFGLARFGFLDNVLSASLLKGFIAGVGIVMIITSSIIILGLEALMKRISDDPNEMDIHSPFDKVRFLAHYIGEYNSLSTKMGLTGFAIIMAVRLFKKYSARRKGFFNRYAVLIPEILLVVAGSTILCQYYRWDLQGISVIGKVKNNGEFKLYNPISFSSWHLVKKLCTSGLMCAMLGFFESTTASKSLGSSYDLPISSNRELVALGSINIIGSIFGALPAFGGYGRSKVNAISAKTTMSGAIMGVCTLLTVQFLLKYLYFVPQCMLSVVAAAIGISLIEEAPYELYFHWRTRGFNELITFGVTVFTTLFFSMEGGIAVGIVYSLIRVIKNSTLSRIQILGRYPNTNRFVDADIPTYQSQEKIGSHLNLFDDAQLMSLNTSVLEEVEGCLIVKIPEPLTFTNCSDLTARLKRVELYGSTKAHPASKRSRDSSMTNYVIFDLKGMSSIDSTAVKILKDLIKSYSSRGIRTLFVRLNQDSKLRKRFEDAGIVDLLVDNLTALNYFEMQELAEQNNASVATPEMEAILGCYSLVEGVTHPYFNHISDALKVIDCYEINYDNLSIECIDA